MLGENGAGKSTLLALILGEVVPQAGGGVERFGAPAEAEILSARRRIGLVSAGLEAAYGFDLTAQEAVWFGFFASIGLYEEVSAGQRRSAARIMEALGVAHLAERRIHGLSAGERRRVFLARALAPGPELLLLDEPASGLDTASRAALLAILERTVASGATVVLVTHRPDEIAPGIQRVLCLERGRIVFQGGLAEGLRLPARPQGAGAEKCGKIGKKV